MYYELLALFGSSAEPLVPNFIPNLKGEIEVMRIWYQVQKLEKWMFSQNVAFEGEDVTAILLRYRRPTSDKSCSSFHR